MYFDFDKLYLFLLTQTMEKHLNVEEKRINGMQIESLLQRYPDIEIFAIGPAGQRIQLVMNRGQLSCKEGLNIKIFDQRYKEYLLETDLTKAVEKVKNVETLTVQPEITQLPQIRQGSRLSLAYWASKVSSLPEQPASVAKATKRRIIETAKEVDKREIALVKCYLPTSGLPAGFSEVAEKYLDLIWEANSEEMQKRGNNFDGVIKVVAEIRNFGRLLTEIRNKLDKLQEKVSYTITGDQKGYTVAKLEVNFDYSAVSDGSNDEDDKIPF